MAIDSTTKEMWIANCLANSVCVWAWRVDEADDRGAFCRVYRRPPSVVFLATLPGSFEPAETHRGWVGDAAGRAGAYVRHGAYEHKVHGLCLVHGSMDSFYSRGLSGLGRASPGG